MDGRFIVYDSNEQELFTDSNPGAVKLPSGETVTLEAPSSGGWDDWFSADLDESEEEVKDGDGVLAGIFVINLSASKRYLKIFYAAADDVTVGTTEADRDLPIPTLGDNKGAGFSVSIPSPGMGFSDGLTLAATTGKGLTDDGAPGADEVVAWAWYK